LAEEGEWVLEDEFIDGARGMSAAFHFEGGFWDGEGVTDAPIAGGVHPDPFVGIDFDHIDGAGGGAFGFGVEGHAGPHPGIEDEFDGMFLDVIDDDAGGFDAGVVFEDVEDEACAFEFIFEVGGMDEDELVEAVGEVDVHFEDFEFVTGIFIEADFADAEDIWPGDEVWDDGDDFGSELEIFGFLGVDTEPGEVGEAEFCGALWFVLGELGEVIMEPVDGAAVEAGPERGFADGLAAGGDHFEVVVGGAADHVGVGFDVVHGGSGMRDA
jgi:hypothetical protein